MTEADEPLEERSYRAVTGATEWLTELRRSADLEGFDPFSDGFTDYERGFVSVAEGLTTVLLVRIAERERGVDLGTRRYTDELMAEDLEYLLGEIEAERFRGTPYLDGEDTDNFTDGISFATSVLLAARDLDVDVVDEARIDDALERTVDWFLENAVESDHGAGWAWCGSEEMAERDDYYPPQTYFTFSACVALTDALREAPDVVGDRRAEIVGVLEDAKRFLVADNRVGDGWIEFEPTTDLTPDGYDEFNPSPSLLSTCYTVWALCYLTDAVDEISLTEDERAAVDDGMEFVLDLVESNLERVYAYSRRYQCHRDGDRYYEGTTPYTLLNALLTYGDRFGGDDRTESLVSELTEQVLETCWAGTPSEPNAGFRHFESQDVESSRNVIVIYATQVAVESLLAYGIEPPETTSVRTEVSEAMRRAEEEILELIERQELPDGTVDEPAVEAADVERMNRGHVSLYRSSREALRENFQTLWLDEVSDRLTNVTMNKIQQVPDDPVDIHVDAFLELLLDECYFETDPEAFRDRIEKYRKDYEGFVMLPHGEVLEELASLDDAVVADPIERKKRIRDQLEALTDDVTNGYDPKAIARDYNETLGD